LPEYKVPMRDIQFALNEVLGFERHYQNLPGAEDASPDMIGAILEEAARFCEKVISPLNAVGDRQGCQWSEGRVTTPPGFKEAYDQFVEGGWTGLSHPAEFGGQGLPASLAAVVHEMLASANHAWLMYSSLTGGAINTINNYGSEEQKRLFLGPLVSGSWSGTMCLTEAHCGSDLGLLHTRAEPNGDGSYSISGSKIFISAGEHDLTENIVHVLLARLPDAPAGTKGISMFLVPKMSINEDGSLGGANGVSCGSIEHKMGINGNATCVLNFDSARGYLIGPPNKGLNCMFSFINESRLAVAQQAHAHIESSFQGALAYAKERLQMRAPVRVLPDKPADPIVAHPDVRRMLLTQKAFSEGGRLLNYYCAQLVDTTLYSEDANARRQAETLLALLTPIAKGFLSEISLEATSNGVQVLGGHGYICEWGMEQEYRDTRITAIYEGTNGIQALDLLARKILASSGKIMTPFIDEINSFCRAKQPETVQRLVDLLARAVEQWSALTSQISRTASDDPNAPGAAAYDYLMFSGYTTLAYFWAKSAAVAARALESGSQESGFYRAKLAIAQFYFDRILPRNQSLAMTIGSGAENLMQLPVEDFAYSSPFKCLRSLKSRVLERYIQAGATV